MQGPPERYQVEGELARGAMGVVYRARDTHSGREVALKRVLLEDSSQDLARVEVEALATTRLDHPNIVRLHGIHGERRQRWLVLDLVQGESLFERLVREGPLEPLAAARLMRDLASALAHAHERGVLHRDVKPQNVLLASDGRPLLTDFGLARLSDSDMGLTRSGELIGTPAFMSPEQALGLRHELGPATDQYCLAATVHHALTGRPPFLCDSLQATLAQIVHQPLPPLSSVRPDVPPGLEAIVRRCLAKRPVERFPSARALTRELDRFLGATRTEVVVVSRRWVKLSAGLALGSLLLAGLALLAVRAPSTTAGVAPPPPVDTPPVSALSAPGTSPPEPEPEPGPPPPTSPGRCSQEALALYRQLRPREALALIERGAELWPASDDVGLVRARLLAAHGRWDEAARAYRELRERSVVLDEQDPWGEEYRAFTVERILAVHGERAPEAPPGFSLLLGGSWELDPAGVFRASQGGIGTFQLSALMRDEAPALPARVGVELRLDSQSRGPEVRAYAGLLLGGRALDDFLCLFLLRDAGDPFSRQVIERQGLRPGQPGYPPTVLRLTHQRGTEWRFLANELLPPGAREWTALEAELRGQRLVVRVDGRQALDGELPRDLEGQVGLLKFYVDQVEMRAFRCEPLGGQPSIR